MAKTKKKQNAKATVVDAYIEKAESIQSMLFELTQYADDLFADDPENTTLADVRRLDSIEKKLKRINDIAFREGA